MWQDTGDDSPNASRSPSCSSSSSTSPQSTYFQTPAGFFPSGSKEVSAWEAHGLFGNCRFTRSLSEGSGRHMLDTSSSSAHSLANDSTTNRNKSSLSGAKTSPVRTRHGGLSVRGPVETLFSRRKKPPDSDSEHSASDTPEASTPEVGSGAGGHGHIHTSVFLVSKVAPSSPARVSHNIIHYSMRLLEASGFEETCAMEPHATSTSQ
jgi:hypothetical protein